jgi:pyrimidine deaminase RibD-like protein
MDDNTELTTAQTLQNAFFKAAIAGRYLEKKRNTYIQGEFLVDIHLTKAGEKLIQAELDRPFCEQGVAEARKSVAEKDGRLHPRVGVVVVKAGTILATGHRGESGIGDHGEYCALQKLNADALQAATVYTTLEPCTIRKSPEKIPCTTRLIESKVARVVYGMADKDESVFGHARLVENGIAVSLFPDDLIEELVALNKDWSDSLRPNVPANNTPSIADALYYELGTSIADCIHLFVHAPNEEGGFYTVEDATGKVLQHGRTIEEIAVKWNNIDRQMVVGKKLVRHNDRNNSGNPLLNLP